MLFRNRRLARALACFFLLEIVSTLAFPAVTFAMSGPSQPEFTSYEAPGSTDMVNLSTGNFSFSIPAIDIPGPERSFSLPLSYNAGIMLEQEASWVGLGWSLNAGAIARSVNGYPDDANDEPIRMTFDKNIDRGWTGGIPGFVELGWNSITGHSGSVDLLGLAKVGWDKDGVNEGDLVGIGYSAAHGFGVDPVRLAMAAYTIATFGAATPFTVAVNVGIQAATSAAMTVGLHALGIGVLGGVAGFNNNPTRDVQSHLFYDNYWNFYKNKTTEMAFGSLYFGKMSQNVPNFWNEEYQASYLFRYGSNASPVHVQPFHNYRITNEQGNDITETAADVYQDGELREHSTIPRDAYYTRTGENNYRLTSRRPISTAHDNFSVMGEQVSGSIRPFRLDVGSIAYPKMGTEVVYDVTQNRSYFWEHKYMTVPFLDNYKVGFRYENDLSNAYDYQAGNAASGNEPEGIDSSPEVSPRNPVLTITDPRLLNARVEPARKGLVANSNSSTDMRLVHGKHIVWYSNAEIKTLYANPSTRASSDFLEFDVPVANAGSNNPFRESLPQNGIGAFAVTAEDGTTYHYSLPVYQFKTFSESNEVRTSNTVGDLGRSTRVTGETGATNPNNPTGASAITWLLTAITSSDYIDRNNSGTVDAGDWGGWVQFNYGKFSSQYKWRQPYIGESYSDENSTINTLSHTEGFKETYYLNSIATRTHTALFIKSVRQDGRGHFQTGVTAATSSLSINEQLPSSSLRLDEVILVDNQTLNTLQTPDGIRAPNDPNPVPALSTNTYPSNRLLNLLNQGVAPSDNVGKVLDISDLASWTMYTQADSRIKDYLYANCIKRTRFNYDYDLCRGYPNSFAFDGSTASLPAMSQGQISANRGGKLTLKSVSFFGPTTAQGVNKIVPDFLFGYGSTANDNPNYGKEKWDAFGMYNATGMQSVDSHQPSQSSSAIIPWTLTKITSPLGGVTEIQFERDQYAHVSEFGTRRIHLGNTNCSAVLNSSLPSGSGTGFDLRTVLHANQTIYAIGTATFSPCNVTGTDYPANRTLVSTPLVIASVSPPNSNYQNNQVTLTAALQPDVTVGPCANGSTIPYGVSFDIVVPATVSGGDVRVAQITTSTDERSYRVRYKYVNDIRPNADNSVWAANSSGVLSKEPAFLDRFERAANGMFDYPTTPVIYGKVTVLRGELTDDTDYDVREEYNFYTPTTEMISEPLANWRYINNAANRSIGLSSVNNQSVVKTGLIGQPKIISTYNSRGQQELFTRMNYTTEVRNPDNISMQGQFTEGVLNTEFVRGEMFYNRSVKTYMPSVLSSTQSSRNGLTITNENILHDFYTGQTVETAFTNSANEVYHNRMVPAYQKYPAMGPKGENATNSHMLTQQTAAYAFKEIKGRAYDPLDFLNPASVQVLSASVQTWNDTWNNYRAPSQAQSGSAYVDAADSPRPVWREAASIVWRSSALTPTGAISNFVDYDWLGTPDTHWIKTSQALRYDHYSHLLETKDVNNQYSTQKVGYNNSQQLASASNSRYTEVMYSGAEDVAADNGAYFGGEVAIGGTADAAAAHTGRYSNRLDAQQSGFVYRAHAATSFASGDLLLGKSYRVSAWVRAASGGALANAQLFAANSGTALPSPWVSAVERRQAGDWTRLTMTVTLPAWATDVSIGCRNAGSGSLYFDDFRVCPSNAAMTAKAYNGRNNNITETLDEENLFTRFEYNSGGRLQRIYKESFTRPNDNSPTVKLVKEYAYNYARNASYTVQATSTGTGQVTSSLPGGLTNIVENFGVVRYTAVSTDCHWLFSLDQPNAIKIDGVAVANDLTLTDGTLVARMPDGCVLTNVRGGHLVELQFTNFQFPTAGTHVNEQCEICQSTGQYTGYLLYQVADGCGQYQNNGEWSKALNTNRCRGNANLVEGIQQITIKAQANEPSITDCPVAPSGKIIGNPNIKRVTPNQRVKNNRTLNNSTGLSILK